MTENISEAQEERAFGRRPTYTGTGKMEIKCVADVDSECQDGQKEGGKKLAPKKPPLRKTVLRINRGLDILECDYVGLKKGVGRGRTSYE